MPAKNQKEPARGRHAGGHRIEGHTVEIRQRDDREELWIDGERRRFFVTRDGYTLHADAYAPPAKTLMEAVKNYLSLKPDIGPGHEH
jgi:hypothetical protein